MTDNPQNDDNARMLREVPAESNFMLKDGSSIGSLKALYQSLRSMEEEVFSHHVSDEKNDFGNWVKDVFKDYQLANKLFEAKSRSECLNHVGTRLYDLEKKTAPPSKVMLRPALPIRPKPQASSKSKMDVDPAELEKTIQEITRRYWEKKKIEEASNKFMAGGPSEVSKTEETKKEDIPEAIEDLIAHARKRRFGSEMLADAKKIFSLSGLSDTAAEVKSVVWPSDRKETKEEERRLIKEASSEEQTDKERLISELKKAHNFTDGEI